MSTPSSDPPTEPAITPGPKPVPVDSTDATMVGQGPLITTSPAVAAPAAAPPVAAPPAYSPPPPSEPANPPSASYSLPILIGVFVLALVGVALLGLGIYVVVKFNSNPLAAA